MEDMKIKTKLMLLNKKEVAGLVRYSCSHIQRLENKGKFPKRIRLGPSKVVWKVTDIEQWLNDKARQSLNIQ